MTLQYVNLDVDDSIRREDVYFSYWIVTCGGVGLNMYFKKI